MGKAEDEQSQPSTPLDARGTTPAAGSSNGCCLGCTRLRKSVTFRCVFVLLLGVAVLLSAVFWLPFFRFRDRQDPDLDYAGYDIVASFMLSKPASFLQDHVLRLEGDIFDEMSFPSVKVEIISAKPSAEPNRTRVVFAVESDLTSQSLIRDSFMYLISRQSVLHLTASLFGDPFSFEVLKFRGGITASPEQKAFLMQSGQILFNFTLNFCIDQILNNFDELRSQLRMGLDLAPYENLYISLTNFKGSTIDPPTTVESKVLLAVGISKSRIKQLAQTITRSHSKNLGLNNTVFGRVKQVRLSSILQHSLGSEGSGPSPSPSPAPSPLPRSHLHHHPHHHHPYSPMASPAPHIPPSPSTGHHKAATGRGPPAFTPVPAPAPVPVKNKAAPPPACHFGNGNKFPWKHNKHPRSAPSSAPGYAPNAAPSQPRHTDSPPPKLSLAPAPSPRHVAYIHSHPPSKSEVRARPLDIMVSPSPSPSSTGITGSSVQALLLLALVMFLLP